MAKGSTWVVEEKDGRLTAVRYLPPPPFRPSRSPAVRRPVPEYATFRPYHRGEPCASPPSTSDRTRSTCSSWTPPPTATSCPWPATRRPCAWATWSPGRAGSPRPALAKAIATIQRFKSQADGLGAIEIMACATSAIRDADNGGEVIDAIYAATGVRVTLLSGIEEARLIFQAVRASVVIDPGPALCLDLGGGSLEVMVGGPEGLLRAATLPLGVGRLTTELVRDDPPSADDARRLRERITATLAPVAEEMASLRPDDDRRHQRHPVRPGPHGRRPAHGRGAGVAEPDHRQPGGASRPSTPTSWRPPWPSGPRWPASTPAGPTRCPPARWWRWWPWSCSASPSSP